MADYPLSGQKSLGAQKAVTTLLIIVFHFSLYFRIQSAAFLEIDGTNLHKTKQEIRKLLKGHAAT